LRLQEETFDGTLRVTQDTLLPENLLDAPSHHPADQRADDSRYRVEPGARMLPALVPNEVRIRQDERVVLFQGALHEERDRALRGAEGRVGVDVAGLY
jgi:hypothetical protein